MFYAILILMNKKYLLGIGILLIIIIVGFIAWRSAKNARPVSTSNSLAHQRAPLPKEVNVILSKTGFSPTQVTINVGSAVRWKNESGSQQTVNSDNYPTNQLHRELNFGIFASGSSVTHIFMKPGTYGYHNQLNPKQSGEIVVKK
jgi:plastocyanin